MDQNLHVYVFISAMHTHDAHVDFTFIKIPKSFRFEMIPKMDKSTAAAMWESIF